MQKNEVVRVRIEDIGVNGEGIGKADGYTLFIKDAVIGDVVVAKIVKAKKQYGYARLMKLVEESPYRVKPVCTVARQCGGCQIQEMSYERQLIFKEQKVRKNLERIGGLPAALLDQVMEPIVGMEQPFHYRNKAQFPIGTDKNGQAIAGFYAGRTHQIIPNTDCALGVEINQVILEMVLVFMNEYGIDAYHEEVHRGLIRHVLIRYGFTTKEIMVCMVVNGERIPKVDVLIERLRGIDGMTSITLSVNKEKTNVIMGNKINVLWGKEYITDYIGDVKYQISPLSFYQVNPVQTENLYGLALEYAGLTGKETVWDLYCGIGTISLFLAKKAKQVYGVEIVPQAIEDARENARVNGIENAVFYVGKAEEVLPEYYRRAKAETGAAVRADVIVVDPPRKGCEETLLATMADMKPKRIVYVSCDSATLARDVKYLMGRGYEVARVRGVDQFPMSGHVETVALLTRNKDVERIDIKMSMEEITSTTENGKEGPYGDFGLEKKVINEICLLAKKYDIDKIILFGSRARGDYKNVSDIDIAVSGGDVNQFTISVDEDTSTLLEYDIVNLNGSVQEELRTIIKKEGKIIYEKV